KRIHRRLYSEDPRRDRRAAGAPDPRRIAAPSRRSVPPADRTRLHRAAVEGILSGRLATTSDACRVGKGAFAPCPPCIPSLDENGGHACALPIYGFSLVRSAAPARPSSPPAYWPPP